MPILTPRLRIQPRSIGEGPILNQAICSSQDHLKAWLPFAEKRPSLEDSEEHCRRALARFILREDLTLSIYSRDGKDLIGSTGFHRMDWDVPRVEIGYWVRREFEGQGLVTEAVNALTRYAFAVIKARRVEIRCDAKNLRSLSIMDRLGYAREGILRNQGILASGEPRDTIITARIDAAGLPELDVTWAAAPGR